MSLWSTSAHAALISVEYLVTATSGPLIGATAVGSFTFSSALIAPGGGTVTGGNLAFDLAFTWNGIAYDENSAKLATLEFDASERLVRAMLGNNCTEDSCSVSSGKEQWLVDFPSKFGYAVGGGTGVFGGDVRPGRVSVVPAPATLALLGLGTASLLLVRRLTGR